MYTYIKNTVEIICKNNKIKIYYNSKINSHDH